MRAVIDEGVDDPAIIHAARRLAVGAGVRREFAQALAIRGFLARVWRFVDDPMDRELLQDAPSLLAEYMATGTASGDCDEAAIFGATLGKAIGLDATLTVLAFPVPGEAPSPQDQFCHVYATLLTPAGQAVDLDVTRPRGPVPLPSRVLSVDV
jgi:hypothetical protein